jgi:hypothetical protein
MTGFTRICLVFPFLLFFTVLRSQETVIRVTFSQPTKLAADAGEDQDLYTGQSLTLGTDVSITGGTPGYQLTWKDTGGNEYVTPTIAVTVPGSYYLTVTDEKHCTDTDSVRVSWVTATDNTNAVSGFSLFPNPSGGVFFFRAEHLENPVKLEVISADGRVVFKQDFEIINPEFTGRIDLSGFDKGAYYVKLTGTGGSLTNSIIIK